MSGTLANKVLVNRQIVAVVAEMPSQVWEQIQANGERITAALLTAGLVLLIGLVTWNSERLLQEQQEQLVADAKLAPITVFPDFSVITDVSVKKQQFFDYLEDFIAAENRYMAALRLAVEENGQAVLGGDNFSDEERATVYEIAELFNLETEEMSDDEVVAELLTRVDTIPASLVLAQAANESAWGTSRFALEGNNIFGQWCYVPGCGLVPQRRIQGATHEVKYFDSIPEAIRGYFLNINSNEVYTYLRTLRSAMRRRNAPYDSLALAIGLGSYSERGDHYVDEIQNMILQNDLKERD